jgi:D-hexose-6-phosphate mutarotase
MLVYKNLKLIYNNVKLELSQKGFDQWMICSPGQELVKSIPDLPNNDWDKFIWIEPILASKPKILQPRAVFNSKLNVDN